ncbi:eukaryotic translation initiation factor 3subunit 7 [Striga asiatica]|uniref:Eukaryotic translation initiation factor 3subunit 7 n=1 Tax=Striga asiatica TaxID=4170 RepID=A0A5A7P402_STRAF|nr:eukaryotic translation initiation factor 3subunit 7 [Striga asiatica]
MFGKLLNSRHRVTAIHRRTPPVIHFLEPHFSQIGNHKSPVQRETRSASRDHEVHHRPHVLLGCLRFGPPHELHRVIQRFARQISGGGDHRREDKGVAVVAVGERRVEPLPKIHDAVEPEHLVGVGSQGRRAAPPEAGRDEFEFGATAAEVGMESRAEGGGLGRTEEEGAMDVVVNGGGVLVFVLEVDAGDSRWVPRGDEEVSVPDWEDGGGVGPAGELADGGHELDDACAVEHAQQHQ